MFCIKTKLLMLHLLCAFSDGSDQEEPSKIPNYCLPMNGCKAGEHTVCKRNNYCGPSRSCSRVRLTPEFRQGILDAHNKIRNGTGELLNVTGIKNMYALTYDLELEYIAQCYVNMCPKEDNGGCGDTERWRVGRNFYAGLRDEEQYAEAIEAWQNESKWMTDKEWYQKFPGDFPRDGKPRAHFTQMVWAATRRVGCAMAQRAKKKFVLACSYGPAGNVAGRPIFVHGGNASACDEDEVNDDYEGLCGAVPEAPQAAAWSGAFKGAVLKVLLVGFGFLRFGF